MLEGRGCIERSVELAEPVAKAGTRGAAFGRGGLLMSSATILVVDDEQRVLDGLIRSLRWSKYTVLSATSPEAALELLRDHPVDLIISDHLMPGMSGLEFLKLVRDRFPDTVRVMLTGHADMETAVKAINEGEIYRFLSKPCSHAELQVTVHLALEQLELSRENRRLLAVIRTRPELVAQLEESRRSRKG
jgi:DNA-binding NtrC family response regulator